MTLSAAPKPHTLLSLRQHFLRLLDDLAAINARHGGESLPAHRLGDLRKDVEAYEVTLPLIGSFSAGKSSLINTFLGERLLKTGLRPTTAVPTELRYAETSHAVVVGVDGQARALTLEDFAEREFTVDDTRLVRLYLNNARVAPYRNVVLVDFPGLDSGLAIHNLAIDAYLPQSVAYLIVLDAEVGLTASVVNVLSEIGLHRKPVAVAVTKTDKKPEADIQNILSHTRRQVRESLGAEPYEFFASSNRQDADYPLDTTLAKLDAQAPTLFAERFAPEIKELILMMQGHLVAQLRFGGLGDDELDRLLDEHQRQLEEMVRVVDREWAGLDRQLDQAASAILAQVRAGLSHEAASLANLAADHSAFNSRLNAIVRQTVTRGLQQEVEPLVQRQLEALGQQLSDQVGYFSAPRADAEAQPTSAPGAPFGDILGELFRILKPGGSKKGGPSSLLAFLPPLPPVLLIQLVTTIAETLFGLLFGKPQADRAAEHARLEQRLQSEVFPQVLARLETPLRQAIADLKAKVRQGILDRLQEQRRGIEAAAAEVRGQRDAQRATQQARHDALASDLETLRQQLAAL